MLTVWHFVIDFEWKSAQYQDLLSCIIINTIACPLVQIWIDFPLFQSIPYPSFLLENLDGNRSFAGELCSFLRFRRMWLELKTFFVEFPMPSVPCLNRWLWLASLTNMLPFIYFAAINRMQAETRIYYNLRFTRALLIAHRHVCTSSLSTLYWLNECANKNCEVFFFIVPFEPVRLWVWVGQTAIANIYLSHLQFERTFLWNLFILGPARNKK